MKRYFSSFSKRLSMNIVLITSIVFIISLVAMALTSYKLIYEEASKAAGYKLESTVKQIENVLQDVEKSVKDVSWLVKENLNDPDYLYHITSKLVEENKYIIGSTVAFRMNYFPEKLYFAPYSHIENNSIRTKNLGGKDYDYFYMDWYQIAELLGTPVWNEPYYDEGGVNQYVSTYSFPLKDEDDEVFAILTADISLDWLSNMISSMKPYENSATYLASRNASFMTLGNDEDLRGETLFSYPLEVDDPKAHDISIAMANRETGTKRMGKGKNASFVVYGALNNGWSVATVSLFKDIFAKTDTMIMLLIIIGVIALVLMFFFCYTTISKLSKPLAVFSDSAMEIAHGDFNCPLPEIHSKDEIKKLRDSFEYMQVSLTNYIEELKTSTAENQRFESELNIAAAIQKGMLPIDFPDKGDVDLYADLIPAKEVGGDLYDFFIRDNILYFSIGDVSGKGVPASLVMAITKSAFRFISGLNLTLDQIVSQMNNAVTEGNSTGMFVTMFVGRLNLDTGELQYCNAGHNPIVLNGRFLDVKPNIAIGLFQDFPYQMQTTHLEKGSRLILYTDGVTEAETSDKNQYGEPRLLEWVSGLTSETSSKDATEDLLASIRKFTDGAVQNDDITIMTIKY